MTSKRKLRRNRGRPPTPLVAPRISLPPPDGWGSDPLSAYFEQANRNRWATFANRKQDFAELLGIDACLAKLDGWRDPSDLLSPQLGLRCLGAFRAACEHAAAGQLADVFPTSRVCLESAAYAVLAHKNTEVATAWLERHSSSDAVKQVRKLFSHQAIIKSLANHDPEVSNHYDELYQHCIDFGAHPNERGMSVSGRLEHEEGERRISHVLLHVDGPRLSFGLQVAKEVGACTVAMLRLIFADRLGETGPDDREHMKRLREQRPSFADVRQSPVANLY